MIGDVLSDVATLAWRARRGNPLQRPGVVRSYAALRVMLAFERRSGLFAVTPERPGRSRIAGWDLAYPDRQSALNLLDELVVEAVYDVPDAAGTPLLIDAGAHIGMATLVMKCIAPAARVRAFEPEPTLYARLLDNVRRNGLEDIEAHNVALGGRRGTVELTTSPTGMGNSVRERPEQDTTSGSVTVAQVPLSAYVDGPVAFLKLDVEGSELEVLRDLEREDKLDLISSTVVEVHHLADRCDDALGDVLGILHRSGFRYDVEQGPRPVAGRPVQTYLVRAGRPRG